MAARKALPFLRITNYDRYQHYKDRRPIWIKLYVELLDDYDLNRQKPPTRLLAQLLLLIASSQPANLVPNDAAWIASKTHLRVADVRESVAKLVSIGYLTLAGRYQRASKSLADPEHLATPEKEVDLEKEVTNGSSGSRGVRPKGLPVENEFLVAKLVRLCGASADAGTEGVFKAYARRVPQAALAKVIESTERQPVRLRAAYANGALRSEIAERDAA